MDTFKKIEDAAGIVCVNCVCIDLDMCDNCPVRRTIDHLNRENSGCKPQLEEALMDLIHKEGPKSINLFAADIKLTVKISNINCKIETVWYSDNEDKIYLHVCCPEFEANIDPSSLPNDIQSKLRDNILKYF